MEYVTRVSSSSFEPDKQQPFSMVPKLFKIWRAVPVVICAEKHFPTLEPRRGTLFIVLVEEEPQIFKDLPVDGRSPNWSRIRLECRSQRSPSDRVESNLDVTIVNSGSASGSLEDGYASKDTLLHNSNLLVVQRLVLIAEFRSKATLPIYVIWNRE